MLTQTRGWMFKFSLIPREEKFFDLFDESARNVARTAQELKKLVDNWAEVDIEQAVNEITELEHKGDTVTHQILAQLHRTFLTPFDREDIALLAHSLDDITDSIHAAADAMLIYSIKQPSQRVKELADIIVLAAIEVEKAIPRLKQRKELKQVLERCVEINRLENIGDTLYRSAMAELFDNSLDLAYVIKWREIYEHMESAIDRCEDVANVLEGVALKHA